MSENINDELYVEYYQDSNFFKKFGINSIIEFYSYLYKQDLNLGVVNVSNLNPKQLNSLLGFHVGLSRNGYMAYFNKNLELVVTSQYRFAKLSTEEMDSILFFTDSFGMNVDFLFKE